MIKTYFDYISPRDQILMIMERIYGYGMTTTSGGNLSLKDDEGNIWISPGGVDKGQLKAADIVCVKSDGTVAGIHKPSSELPFHKAIYGCRPDIRAILHAHPPALVSFSIAKRIPDTRILPKARAICGEVGFAPYRRPGSDALGEVVAHTFEQGHDTVVLENHGIVTGGETLFAAFRRFETLDFCARLILKARLIGEAQPLSDEELALSKTNTKALEEIKVSSHSSREKELRTTMRDLIHRAYDQQLFTSTEGTFSVRIEKDAFIITPYDIDRKYINIEDLVLIKGKKREEGKVPSRSVLLHDAIYASTPGINAVMIAHPPNVMAYGVARMPFDTRFFPESYVFLRDVPLLKFGKHYTEVSEVASLISDSTPVVLVENDCLIVTGKDLIQCFDRLEVAEYSANSLISARTLGPLIPIEEYHIRDLIKTFLS